MKLDKCLLLIDAGNTSLKWAVFDGESLTEQQRCFYSHGVQTAFDTYHDVVKNQLDHYADLSIIMVSVLGHEFNLKAHEMAEKKGVRFKQIKSVQFLAKINNAYDEPYKLGADRFVAMIGAYYLSNKQHDNNSLKNKKACIIIDAGTATTIDAVDSKGNHLGGLILPGINLCKQSLLKNTQQLPLWGSPENQNKPECNLFSTNTIDAIHSASILGLSGAIEQISLTMEKQIKMKDAQLKVDKYLCGGSSDLLSTYLSSSFKRQENLIMIGLINSVLIPDAQNRFENE